MKNYIKGIIAAISIVLTIVGAIWAMEDRYASDKDVANSLQILDQRIQYQITDVKRTIIQKELSYITEQYYKLKKLAIDHPDDLELQLEFDELKVKREHLKDQLND